MGRLAGFRYRDITRKLKVCGFEFDRQAAGSHEIWFNPPRESLHNSAESSRRHARRNAASDIEAGGNRDGLLSASVNHDCPLGKSILLLRLRCEDRGQQIGHRGIPCQVRILLAAVVVDVEALVELAVL